MLYAKNMKPEQYEEFKEWYDKVDRSVAWNFKDEFIKYCEADVVLLAKSVLEFRNLLKKNV